GHRVQRRGVAMAKEHRAEHGRCIEWPTLDGINEEEPQGDGGGAENSGDEPLLVRQDAPADGRRREHRHGGRRCFSLSCHGPSLSSRLRAPPLLAIGRRFSATTTSTITSDIPVGTFTASSRAWPG